MNHPLWIFARSRLVAVVLAGTFALAWYGLLQAPAMGLVSAIVGTEASGGNRLTIAGFLRLAAGVLAFTALPTTAYMWWLRIMEPEGAAGMRTGTYFLGLGAGIGSLAFFAVGWLANSIFSLAPRDAYRAFASGALEGEGHVVGDLVYGAAIATALLLALGFIRAGETPVRGSGSPPRLVGVAAGSCGCDRAPGRGCTLLGVAAAGSRKPRLTGARAPRPRPVLRPWTGRRQ